MGRVVEEKGIEPPSVDDTPWQNFKRAVRWFESDEIPRARVRIRFCGAEIETETDEDGAYAAELTPARVPPAQHWHTATVELLDEIIPGQWPVRSRAEILIVQPSDRFGIISDIDDTVLQSHVTRVLQMLRVTFLSNAMTRLPFAGTAAFYEALRAGPQGNQQNPIFYVSRSPWNLYEFLELFFEQQQIPKGPFLLRDLGLRRRRRYAPDYDHKLAQMRRLLTVYPELPFILIGDSGEKDPELFLRIINEFPGRVLAAYVRDVTSPTRDLAVRHIAEEVQAQGVPMVLAADSVTAAEHAASAGFIHVEALLSVRGERLEQSTY